MKGSNNNTKGLFVFYGCFIVAAFIGALTYEIRNNKPLEGSIFTGIILIISILVVIFLRPKRKQS